MSRVCGALIGIPLLLLGATGVGWSKPVLQEDFTERPAGMRGGEIVPGQGGSAWRGPGGDVKGVRPYVEYDVKDLGLNASQGTIEFDIVRDERYRIEAPFALLDAGGDRVFSLRFYWEGDDGAPAINIRQANRTFAPFLYLREGGQYKDVSRFVPLGRRVAKGQAMHVALTWNGNQSDILIDGVPLAGQKNEAAPFSALIPLTARILVGGETDLSRNPNGAWSVSHSPVSNFQVHDVALAAAELGQPIAAKGAEVLSVAHGAFQTAGFSGKLVAGDSLQVTVQGTAGATGTVDLVHYTDVEAKIALDWRGWGVYLEEKTFYEADEVNLREVKGYRVYASTASFAAITEGMVPAATLEVEQQSYTLEFLEIDKPYYVAVVAEMPDGTLKPVIWPRTGLPLVETAPGIYTGAITIGPKDQFARAVVVGRISMGTESAALVDMNVLAVDTTLNVAVVAGPNELRADEKSTSKISVTVTDANGKPVAGHKVRFLLATTSQYTGVVGGGAFTEQVGGTLKEDAWGETDLFGRLTTTYTAGFAAKTAIIVARDMVGNGTGAAYVKTYIQSTGELELEPLQVAAADAGYEISVTSSEEWLTADGKSTARITARVSLNGKPVAGHKVAFDVSSGAGSVRAVRDVTDDNGEARAVFTAGKKIGLVVVTATDTTVDISGSVQIELRSDAPAKITIKITPEKLPADGHSSAEVSVLVTDINDNPNDNAEVEYRIASGSGQLGEDRGLTDRDGVSTNEFKAGRQPGRVSIEITVRSTVPTAEELANAQALALAVTDYDFF